MRIERVHIASFGTFRGRTFRFGKGLTVVYGPNESGKSSLKSFVTGTMFPDRLPRYPASGSGDSGEMDVRTADGSLLTIRRSGRRSDSPVPGICGLSGQEYSSIYSMGPDDLRDMGLIEKGGIREKLLSVPGSGMLPRAMADIAAEKTALVPETRRSNRCTISLDREAVLRARASVDSAGRKASGDSDYNALCAEEARLRGELASAEGEERSAFEASMERARTEGLIDIRTQIAELEEKRKAFAYAEKVDAEAYGRAKTLVEEADERLRTSESRLGELEEGLPSDSRVILSLSGRLSGFKNGLAADSPGKKPSLALVAAGGVVAVAGIAIAALIDLSAGVAVAVVGIVAVSAAFVRGRRKDSGSASEKEWRSLCRDFGIEPTTVQKDIVRMENLMTEAEEVERARRAVATARSELDVRKDGMRNLLDRFGISGDADRAVSDKGELSVIDAQLTALRMNASGGTESKPDAKPGFDAASGRSKEILAELAKIEVQKNAILSDRETEKAMDLLAEKRNILLEHIREWTVLAIEKAVLDEACAKSYEANRPAAYAEADGYIGRMTSGRYGLVSEPGDSGLAIVERATGVRKTDDIWSTGTGDQVKLALKMGVARGLCSDNPPMILDDVLLTSDPGRARGCAEAIAELSRSLQVIFFTCSPETRDALASVGAEVVSLE